MFNASGMAGIEEELTNDTGMDSVTFEAPEYDNQIDATRTGVSTRSKTPSASQIPPGTVTNTIKLMETPSKSSKGAKAKKTKQVTSIVAPPDEQLVQMSDSQYTAWKDEQEKIMTANIQAQLLESRKQEIRMLQQAQSIAIAEVQTREKEMAQEWKEF